MKSFTFFLVIFILLSFNSISQVSSINLHYFESIEKAKNDGSMYFVLTYQKSDFYNGYHPQKVGGDQVVKISRSDSGFDDVYFVDKRGNQQYHSVRQTQPVNYMQNRNQYDSCNPHGAESFGEVVGYGIANTISNWIR